MAPASNASATDDRAAIRHLIDNHLMFSALAEAERDALAQLCELHRYRQGDVLANQDHPVDWVICVQSGQVQVKRSRDGKRVRLGELGPGGTLGERALFQDESWPSQVVVSSAEAAVVFVPVAKVKGAFFPAHPASVEALKKRIAVVDLRGRISRLLGSGQQTPTQLLEILQDIGIKRIAQGQPICQQGQQDPRLYLIEHGTAEVSKKDLAGEELSLKKLGRNDIAGIHGALSRYDGGDGTQGHSARAVTDVTVLVVRQGAVKVLLDTNPALLSELRELAAGLERQEHQAKSARDHAEGVNQRIRLTDAVTEEEYLATAKEKAIQRFPLVRQQQPSDAAAACLTMVVRHYDKNFTLGQIRELTSLGIDSPHPNQIIGGAEIMGFSASAYALPYDDLSKMKLPAIVSWEGSHYVVLYQVGASGVQLADPEKGLVKLSKEDFLSGWTRAQVEGEEPGGEERGVFIALNPTVIFERKEPPKRPIGHFIGYIWPHRKHFMEAMLAAVTINFLGLASPLFVQNIIDTVVVHHDVALLNMMLGGMALVTVFTALISSAQSLLLAYTTARIDMRLMAEFYRHVLSLPMGFFLTRNKGEILARFGENAKIRAIIAGSTITTILNTLMIAVYLSMMFMYSVSLTIAVLIFIPFFILITLYFTPRIKAIAQQIFQTNSQQQAHLIESLNGIETLKATSNEYMARAKWENAFVDNVNMGYKQAKLNLLSRALNQLVGLSMTIAILWIGANQVINGSMTIGELMGFNMLVGLITNPINQMVGLWNSFQEVRIAIDRVSDVLNVEPEQQMVVQAERAPKVLPYAEGRIEFEEVHFRYVSNGKENEVMRGFNLTIEPGMHVAFVGPSGCGKSTIAKMILGFNIAQGGECRIDGEDIRNIERGSLREHIGIVLQDGFLFSGTVAENIALGDPEPDMALVREAARMACADEFIINYPLGYQTPIGEKGIGISGGQRQRICIARSLYRQPKIMLFDEATSALDNETEKRVQENLKAFVAGKTTITIAHRLSTITDSDLICYIADGKVQERGRHEELTDPDYLREKGYHGHYYRLAASQFDLPPLQQ